MIADTFGSLLLYLVVAIGLAWPIAARLAVPGPEKLLASAVLSLVGVFLVAWVVYIASLPRAVLWVLPLAAIVGLLAGNRSLRTLWNEPAAREIIFGQALVTGWCVGWLALVVTYSGGGWVADWFGHWQRVSYFLDHGPRDILFNGFDPLTSRPPLANVAIGALLAVTRVDFAHYQLASTVLGSLVFLPAAVLARRFQSLNTETQSPGASWTVRILTVGFMLNPMVVQNATFAWTKLPAAFFTLAALHYFLSGRDPKERFAGPLFALALAAALLTHYSAGPYAVIFAVMWCVRGRTQWQTPAWWRYTALAAGTGVILLATWFGWSLAVYGVKGTFLTNTSVTDQAASASTQLGIALLNVRDTLVPHFLRTVDYGFIAQSSRWGWWRDWFFQLYQVNLLFMFGSVTWLALGAVLIHRARHTAPGSRVAWTLGLASAVLLGIMVHAGRDTWGLAHICLQPVVLLGLAVLAANVVDLNRTWKWILIAGAGVDVVLGISLQFGAESFLLDQWFAPGRPAAAILSSYSASAGLNLRAKLQSKWAFFGDGWAAHDTLLLIALAALLLVAIYRVRPRSAAS